MKNTKIKRNVKYLGFDDTRFMIVGIIVLSFITDYMFNRSFFRYHFGEAIIGWSVSLFFSTFNWFVIREIMIFLRKKFPSFKDNAKRIILFLLAIVSSVLLVNFIGSAFLKNSIGIRFDPIAQSKIILPIIIISTMTMAIYEAVFYYFRLKKSIIDEEQAKQAIVQAQLDALRNQAQPHFLFNTLNTLRDIIEQNSKEEAKKFVDKISDVYRFILESGNANLIPLRDEVKFAQSYTHIQSERFGENLKISWDISDDKLEFLIVPMSLQLLLENAIKHNVISKTRPLSIMVATKDDSLIVSNPLQVKSTKLPSTKLGLKNIEKRYALITEKAMNIEENEGEFKVSIPLLNFSDQKHDHANTDH